MTTEKNDPLAWFEEERSKERQRTTAAPFRFRIKDGERAVIRLLLDFDKVKQCVLPYHERFNGEKYDVASICASVIEQECEYCAQAKTSKDWKLKPQKYVYLPVYVHQIQKMQDGKWAPVTYKEEGLEKPIQGVRMLEMKFKSSTILEDLSELYAESDEEPSSRTITRSDLVISRRGSQLETKYSVRPARSSITLPENLTSYSPELVRTEVLGQYPPVIPNTVANIAIDDDAVEY